MRELIYAVIAKLQIPEVLSLQSTDHRVLERRGRNAAHKKGFNVQRALTFNW